MDRIKIKNKAKKFAFENKWNVWKAILLVSAVMYACSLSIEIICSFNHESYLYSILSLLIEIAVIPLQVGLISYMLKLVRGKKVNLTEELFSKYKGEYIWKIISVCLISSLIIFGFTLLFVVPGIIWAFKFAMTSYILAEQSAGDIEKEKAYDISKKMMDGHKMEFFIFHLSFLGWIILSVLTFGILLIWIVPYISVAEAMWYDELKKISK